MANIREIQSRINSVKDTMKITNAMYMISSSKMTQARKKTWRIQSRIFMDFRVRFPVSMRHVPEIRHSYFDDPPGYPRQSRKGIGSDRNYGDKGLAGALIIILSSWKKRSLHSRGSQALCCR